MIHNIFDGRTEWRVEAPHDIQIELKEVGMSPYPAKIRPKEYRYKECVLAFKYKDITTAFSSATEAIHEFISSNDIFKDAVKIIGMSFPREERTQMKGYVTIAIYASGLLRMRS